MSNSKTFIPISKFTKKDKEYIIHDNGSRPFKVVVNKIDGIRLFSQKKTECITDEDGNEEWVTIYYTVPFKIYHRCLGYWHAKTSFLYAPA